MDHLGLGSGIETGGPLTPSKSKGDAGLTWELTKSVGFPRFRACALGVRLSSGSIKSVLLCEFIV